MKKNVFSRTLAVLASTAVLGAASMMTANAAGESLGMTSATGKAGETVTLEVVVACNNNFESLDVVANWDASSGLTSGEAAGAGGASVASSTGDGFCTVVAYGSGALKDGAVATIDFTIPANATPGTTYNVNFGTVTTFAIFEGDDIAASVPVSGGTITVADEDTTEPTTEPTTEATTEATTEEVTTTKKPEPGAPKTGVAGVAFAFAGLVTAGAAAVVLKKRH